MIFGRLGQFDTSAHTAAEAICPANGTYLATLHRRGFKLLGQLQPAFSSVLISFSMALRCLPVWVWAYI